MILKQILLKIIFIGIATPFFISGCSVQVSQHTDIHHDIAVCGMGIDSNGKPAIESLIADNPELKKHYEACLQQYQSK